MSDPKIANESNVPCLELEKRLRILLVSWGVVPRLRGYQYIVSCAMQLACTAELSADAIYDAYDQTAVSCYSTSGHVEKAIRHAIEISWSLGGERSLCNIFKAAPPDNIAFIVVLLCYIKVDDLKTPAGARKENGPE